MHDDALDVGLALLLLLLLVLLLCVLLLRGVVVGVVLPRLVLVVLVHEGRGLARQLHRDPLRLDPQDAAEDVHAHLDALLRVEHRLVGQVAHGDEPVDSVVQPHLDPEGLPRAGAGVEVVPHLGQLGEVVLPAEGALPQVALALSQRGGLVQLLPLGLLVLEARDLRLHQLPVVESLRRLLGHHVEDLLLGRRAVGLAEVLVHVVQLLADVLQGDRLLSESLPLKLLREGLQVQLAQLLRVLEDLLERVGRVPVVLVVLQGVHRHLPCPLVGLVVDARPVQHLHVHLGVAQAGRVDLDEAGAVDQHLRPHVAEGDQLLPVLQPGLGGLHLAEGLEQGGALPGAEAAHELDQVAGERVRHALVDVHPHLVGPVDELYEEPLQELLLRQQVLQRVVPQAEDLVVGPAQLGELHQRVLHAPGQGDGLAEDLGVVAEVLLRPLGVGVDEGQVVVHQVDLYARELLLLHQVLDEVLNVALDVDGGAVGSAHHDDVRPLLVDELLEEVHVLRLLPGLPLEATVAALEQVLQLEQVSHLSVRL